MSVRTVGIISPGDMGAAIAKVIHDEGLEVVACLEGRGDLTRLRAQESGIRDVGSYDELVKQADLVLSVLVPAEAVSIAELVSASMRATGATPVYADCNAIAPQNVERIAAIVGEAGGTFIDAGIIGPPPSKGSATRIYCSGPDTTALEALKQYGLDIRTIGKGIGQASGMKMLYAASTKGSIALWTELLAVSHAMGLEEALEQEFGNSDAVKRMRNHIPTMPRRSRRWVSEMEEIAATFEHLGLTPRILLGAADIYAQIGESPLGALTSRDTDPSLEKILDTLMEAPKRGSGNQSI